MQPEHVELRSRMKGKGSKSVRDHSKLYPTFLEARHGIESPLDMRGREEERTSLPSYQVSCE